MQTSPPSRQRRGASVSASISRFVPALLSASIFVAMGSLAPQGARAGQAVQSETRSDSSAATPTVGDSSGGRRPTDDSTGETSPTDGPTGGTVRPLGRLEQESVDEELQALGLQIDSRPTGKIVRNIYVVNQEVFSRRDWWFQFFNLFHRTTRPGILRRELLLRSGQPYDEALVEESLRNLQSPPTLVLADGTKFVPPDLSSVVALVPVMSSQDGTVDLLAVTRDIWSLRFNTNFEFQEKTLSYLATSLSENNLFGWRKYLSLGFEMDQGRAGIGPAYFDPNIAGTRLTLVGSVTAWYARDTQRYEGNSEDASLRYPLYALARRWGGGIDFTHQDAVIRSFRGNSLRLEDLIATPGVTEQLPYIFRRKIAIVDASAVRAFGVMVIQRLTFGYRFDRRRSEVMPDFPVDPTNPDLAREFLAEFAPLSETRSESYLRYEMFTARYAIIRNLDTFDLRENRRLGPWLTLEIAAGLPQLGADFRAFPVSGQAGWAFGPGGGYAYAQVLGSARLRSDRAIDQRMNAEIYLASPILGRALRLVVRADADAVRADTYRRLFFLGGNTGLRGYVIGDFEGTSQLVGHVEVRSLPLEVFSQRFGGLLFYDVGHAAPSFSEIVLHHDFGIGFRWLIPQLNSSVMRVDWAVATQGTTLTRAGLPGRFSGGFLQAF
jgi:hypothetical protein